MGQSPNSISSFSEELLRKIWITKGARLNAHRRLKSNHRDSIHAISFLSAYLLIVSLPTALQVLSLPSLQEPHISLVVLALSVLILVLSLLESAKDYQLKAERLHTCALELHGLHDRLRLGLEKSENPKKRFDLLSKANFQYAEILARFSDNHDTIDYEYFQAQNPKEFNLGWFRTLSFKAKWILRTFAFHKSLIWGPPLAFLLWFFIFR